MKKKYYLLIYLILIIVAILVIYLSTWTQIVKNLILINIILYIIRKPLISIIAFFTKKRSYRTIVAIRVNVIWSIFLFWFIFEFDSTLFFAIVPFLIVAVSLNFKNIINNMVSGALLLSSDQFEIGDLIETNDICAKYSEIFGIKPRFHVIEFSNEITVKFRIITLDSNKILKFQPEFAKELYEAIFTDIEL